MLKTPHNAKHVLHHDQFINFVQDVRQDSKDRTQLTHNAEHVLYQGWVVNLVQSFRQDPEDTTADTYLESNRAR